MRLQGSFPALITPFKNGALDDRALRRLARWLLTQGSAGLVPCGSTGEAATLSPDEYKRVVSLCVEEARAHGRPVIAGVGTNATSKAAETAQAAAGLGADALLVLCPYYNKPTQEGLFLHFREVARSVKLPIVVYNIPGRTAVNLLPKTLAKIARECRNVVAVKEASGSLDQVSEILSVCPDGFTVLSGDDSLTLPMISIGAKGVVSVIANILPRETSRLCEAALAGRRAEAERLHARLFPLTKSLFIETNPIPIKAAAAQLGLCLNELRLPLTPMTRRNKSLLLRELRRIGVRRPRIA